MTNGYIPEVYNSKILKMVFADPFSRRFFDIKKRTVKERFFSFPFRPWRKYEVVDKVIEEGPAMDRVHVYAKWSSDEKSVVKLAPKGCCLQRSLGEGFGWAPLSRDCEARYPEKVWAGLESSQTDDSRESTGDI